MLKTRALSALAMAPPALAAAWYGGWWFALMIALGAALVCWEWETMVAGRFTLSGKVAAAGVAVASVLAVALPAWAVVLIPVLVLTAFALASGGVSARAWAAFGPLYGGLPAVALVWLRDDPADGRAIIFWLLLLVWATDIGAYAFGRLIGGPLLLPAVSPKKTWAGLIGGALCAGLSGLGVGLALGQHAVVMTLASAGMAVVSQAGDLAESWVKRRCGVKDSSNIIPGHGGVLDRVDGLLVVAAAVAAVLLTGNEAALGWR
ncbi:MAG: phosphatidate cytidylyltransferase [Actinomycetota bacterium]